MRQQSGLLNMRTTVPTSSRASGDLNGRPLPLGPGLIYSTAALSLFAGGLHATLRRPLAHGDGENWVNGAGRGKILGRVVAASLKTRVAMIMPGPDFFDDIRRAPEVSLEP